MKIYSTKSLAAKEDSVKVEEGLSTGLLKILSLTVFWGLDGQLE